VKPTSASEHLLHALHHHALHHVLGVRPSRSCRCKYRCGRVFFLNEKIVLSQRNGSLHLAVLCSMHLRGHRGVVLENLVVELRVLGFELVDGRVGLDVGEGWPKSMAFELYLLFEVLYHTKLLRGCVRCTGLVTAQEDRHHALHHDFVWVSQPQRPKVLHHEADLRPECHRRRHDLVPDLVGDVVLDVCHVLLLAASRRRVRCRCDLPLDGRLEHGTKRNWPRPLLQELEQFGSIGDGERRAHHLGLEGLGLQLSEICE